MKSIAAIYARVSKDTGDGNIESQLSALKEFANKKSYQIDDDMVFADNGVTGASLARPSLDRLRDKAFAGEIEQILILSPDRLARNYAHQCHQTPFALIENVPEMLDWELYREDYNSGGWRCNHFNVGGFSLLVDVR